VQRGGDVLEDRSSNGLDSVLDYSTGNNGNGDQNKNGTVDLAPLLGLFGPTLTGTIPTATFIAAASSAGGADQFGATTVLTFADRKFAFESNGGTQVSLVGTSPTEIESSFGIELAGFTPPETTSHVIDSSLVNISANGDASLVASVSSNGLAALPASTSLSNFSIQSLVALLAGGQGLTGLIQTPTTPQAASGTLTVTRTGNFPPIPSNGTMVGFSQIPFSVDCAFRRNQRK